MNEVWAFVVGIDRYDQKDWCIQGPVNNALATVSWLLSAKVRPDRISLFVGALDAAPPTQLQEIDSLRAQSVRVSASATFQELDSFYRKDLRDASDAGARLFVYWSGHGFARPDQTRFLICQDFTIAAFRNRALNATQFLNHLNSDNYGGISQCIFLADVCADTRDIEIDAEVNPPRSIARNQSVVAYFGSKIGGYAKAGIGGGVFTHTALSVLSKFDGWPDLKEFSTGMRAEFAGKDHAAHEFWGTDSFGEMRSGGVGCDDDVLSYATVPDGARRQKVLSGLLGEWRQRGRNAELLIGFAGLGKSDRVMRTLLLHTSKLGKPAIKIAIPPHPTNLDEELLSRLVTNLDTELMAHLVEELNDGREKKLLAAVKAKSGFFDALRYLLSRGALVIIDDFQRLLELDTWRPMGTLADKFQRIATRTKDAGCLLLVSNREVNPAWSEPFYTARIEEPETLDDQIRIVLAGLDPSEYEKRFPSNRRSEVAKRLGGNPRLLRLLGQLLATYSLSELLGNAASQKSLPRSSKLTDAIESDLLAKAKEGLTESARQLLINLTIFDEPVDIDLVEAMCAEEADLSSVLDELRARYLVEVHADRYVVHPAVREFELPRLRRNASEWRTLHHRAGTWFARPLIEANVNPLDDYQIAFFLSGARYHLEAANADDDLQKSLEGIGQYIVRKFGWEARRPVSSEERDAQINLLRLYLKRPGHAGVEFNFAKLLRKRGAEIDLAEAYPHAALAAEDCQFSDPWVLWIQIVRDVDGVEASLNQARKALQHVAPDKSLVSVYQLLGANLAHLGRVHEAVESLLAGAKRIEEVIQEQMKCPKGANKTKGRRECEELLVQEAIFFAAAERDDELLKHVHHQIEHNAYYKPEKALATVLLYERHGDWRTGAELARAARCEHKTYLHLALHEAWCWLGARQPDVAEKLLDEFGLKEANRVASLWLAAMVALFNGNLPKASRLLGVYLGREAPTGTQEILNELLSEWDIRVATIGEANPALNFPALPTIVSGVTDVVRRPQYGERVLTMLPRENDVSTRSTSLLTGTLSLSQRGDASFLCSPRPDASRNAGWLTLAKPSQKQGDK